MNSHELRVGDVLHGRDGTARTVLRIEQEYHSAFRVVNLTIDEHHSFAVGPNALLVHNTSECELVAKNAPNVVPKTSTVNGIKAAGKFDDTVGSLAEARAAIKKAFPDAVELPPAIAGQPYPSPPPGVKQWFQAHPPEPGVGNNLPHIKYADWTTGKKGTGGSWGHIFFGE